MKAFSQSAKLFFTLCYMVLVSYRNKWAAAPMNMCTFAWVDVSVLVFIPPGSNVSNYSALSVCCILT